MNTWNQNNTCCRISAGQAALVLPDPLNCVNIENQITALIGGEQAPLVVYYPIVTECNGFLLDLWHSFQIPLASKTKLCIWKEYLGNERYILFLSLGIWRHLANVCLHVLIRFIILYFYKEVITCHLNVRTITFKQITIKSHQTSNQHMRLLGK